MDTVVIDYLGGALFTLEDGRFLGPDVTYPGARTDCFLESKNPIVCLDIRSLLDLDLDFMNKRPIYDVRLLYGDDNLTSLVNEHLEGEHYGELIESELKYQAHLKAIRTARVDTVTNKLCHLVPLWVTRERFLARAMASIDLVDKWLSGHSESDYERTYRFALALCQIERNGIKIDVDYTEQRALAQRVHTATDAHFFRSMVSTHKCGFVHTLLNPAGGKTGRVRLEGGFNCMGIPHGPVRQAIVSRFEGGSICSFDFNAIDYRCIVQSVNEPTFEALYEGVEDFHTTTASFLLGDKVNSFKRNLVKQISYMYIYGGSEDTLSKKTGLSSGKVREILARLDAKLKPIAQFRNQLTEIARADGCVLLPTGGQVPVPRDAHAGKVLGLYAQSFSSHVFAQAVVAVTDVLRSMKSKIIFTVHDELVLDLHPDDEDQIAALVKTMEQALGGFEFKVNVKKGRTYAEATS